MAEPFVGEIKMFAGNFAPRNFAFCDGQTIPVSQNDLLFSLIGCNYGGDCRKNFKLPDMRGRIPIHQGAGPGLTQRRIGQNTGWEKVSLSVDQIPTHNHTLNATSDDADSEDPSGRLYAKTTGETKQLYVETSPNTPMSSSMVATTGAGSAHQNMMPYGCLHFIIALNGEYPSRD